MCVCVVTAVGVILHSVAVLRRLSDSSRCPRLPWRQRIVQQRVTTRIRRVSSVHPDPTSATHGDILHSVRRRRDATGDTTESD